MENFINLISEVWNKGFLGIDLGSIISSLLVILIAFLFRGFIISIILNSLERLAYKTKSKKDSFASLLENKLEPNDNQTNLSTEGNRRQRRMKAKAKRKRR